jgi:hypothetical protein
MGGGYIGGVLILKWMLRKLRFWPRAWAGSVPRKGQTRN